MKDFFWYTLTGAAVLATAMAALGGVVSVAAWAGAHMPMWAAVVLVAAVCGALLGAVAWAVDQ